MRRLRHRGFTLLELLVVITIVAFMTTLAGFNLHGRQYGNLESVARTLTTDLRYVRSRAMINNIPVGISFDLAANTYASGEAKIERSLPDEITLSLTVDQRDAGGHTAWIQFYPDGSSSGGEIRLDSKGRSVEVTTSWLNGYVTLR